MFFYPLPTSTVYRSASITHRPSISLSHTHSHIHTLGGACVEETYKNRSFIVFFCPLSHLGRRWRRLPRTRRPGECPERTASTGERRTPYPTPACGFRIFGWCKQSRANELTLWLLRCLEKIQAPRHAKSHQVPAATTSYSMCDKKIITRQPIHVSLVSCRWRSRVQFLLVWYPRKEK